MNFLRYVPSNIAKSTEAVGIECMTPVTEQINPDQAAALKLTVEQWYGCVGQECKRIGYTKNRRIYSCSVVCRLNVEEGLYEMLIVARARSGRLMAEYSLLIDSFGGACMPDVLTDVLSSNGRSRSVLLVSDLIDLLKIGQEA